MRVRARLRRRAGATSDRCICPRRSARHRPRTEPGPPLEGRRDPSPSRRRCPARNSRAAVRCKRRRNAGSCPARRRRTDAERAVRWDSRSASSSRAARVRGVTRLDHVLPKRGEQIAQRAQWQAVTANRRREGSKRRPDGFSPRSMRSSVASYAASAARARSPAHCLRPRCRPRCGQKW